MTAETRANAGAEKDTLQWLYHHEIEVALTELDSLLGRLHERVDATTTHARDTLKVLKSCYRENVLSVAALDVLLQHLLTLTRMFKHKFN